MPELSDHDVALVRAANPGPLTLSGTNTWIASRDPAWVIDPGPLVEGHLEAVLAEAQARGGVGGIALTHDHRDHAESVSELKRLTGNPPLAAARGSAEITVTDGLRLGPLTAVATPGHAPDHHAFLFGGACFTGDAVLGREASSSRPTPGRWPATSRRWAVYARWSSRCSAPATGRRCGTRGPSSTATSLIASIASGGCSRRSTVACAASQSCSTPLGTTCPSSCDRPRRSRCARTWTGGPARRRPEA